MRPSIIEIEIDLDNVVHSLRIAAIALNVVAGEIEEETAVDLWKPLSFALKNGKTILVRVAGGEYEPFCIYYDTEVGAWVDSETYDVVNPIDFVGPLEFRLLS